MLSVTSKIRGYKEFVGTFRISGGNGEQDVLRAR